MLVFAKVCKPLTLFLFRCIIAHRLLYGGKCGFMNAGFSRCYAKKSVTRVVLHKEVIRKSRHVDQPAVADTVDKDLVGNKQFITQ